MPRLVQSAAILLLGLLAVASNAHAQSYAGDWRGGPSRVRITVESWGPDCGARPQSHTGPAQGNVRVSESGDHLVFHGTPQRRTDGCWSDNRAVRPVSTSHSGGTWRIVCRTRPEDSRGETGTYTLTATDENRISYSESSHYDWQLNDSHCTARATVTQVFTRVGAATTPATPTEVTPTPTPAPAPCTPGRPASLRLRPREAQVEPGGAVRFSARVVDASGCPVPGQRVRWELTRPSGASAQFDAGLFTAAADAAEGEGEFTVTASANGSSARATVVVRTADLSDLIARRANVGVTQTDDTDFELTAESVAAVSARGHEEESEGGSILPLVLAALLILALLVGVTVAIVARRGAKKAATEADESAFPSAPSADLESPGVTAPTPPLAAPPPPAVTPEGGPGEALICPTCRRGYGSETKSCPADGEDLIPYALFVERHRASEKSSGGKICPSCGERFGRNTVFCGKDGSVLVEAN